MEGSAWAEPDLTGLNRSLCFENILSVFNSNSVLRKNENRVGLVHFRSEFVYNRGQRVGEPPKAIGVQVVGDLWKSQVIGNLVYTTLVVI